MIEIAVKYLEKVTGARPWTGDAERVCRGCVIDSRKVGPDSIFVAFPGERVDGNDYARAAIDAGADLVIGSHPHVIFCAPPTSAGAPCSPARTPPSSCCFWPRGTVRACAARWSA